METILRRKLDRIELVGAAMLAVYLLLATAMYLQYVRPM